MTRPPCLISVATGARWRRRLIQRDLSVSRNPSVARVRRRIQITRSRGVRLLEPRVEWTERYEIHDEPTWNVELCCGATGGYIRGSSNEVLLRQAEPEDFSLGRRLTLVAKLDILTATSGRTEWRCPRVAERMRELDTESPVVWPAWCYTGESNTRSTKKWLNKSMSPATTIMCRFLNENAVKSS